MDIEQRLKDLNINLPKLSNNELPFASGVIVDNLVFLSGQTPMIKGEIKRPGIVGSTVTKEEAQKAAEICILNLLSALKSLIGDLNKVKKVVKLNGYVASDKYFTEQPQVIHAASHLLNDIFGKMNSHARTAVGVASLPLGAPVEIEMIVELNT